MLIEFLTNVGFKIMDFEIIEYTTIRDVNIYHESLYNAIWFGKKVTPDNLLEIFKHYTDSEYTLKEYLDIFKKHGFYSTLQPNLRMEIKD